MPVSAVHLIERLFKHLCHKCRVNAKQFGIPYWQAPTTAHQLTISQAEPITQPSTLTPSLDFKSKIRRKHQTEFFRAHQEPGEVKACKSCFKQRSSIQSGSKPIEW